MLYGMFLIKRLDFVSKTNEKTGLKIISQWVY